MAGAEIIWRPLHLLSGACVGKPWGVELPTTLFIGGFSMWLLQVAWLGAKHVNLKTIGFLTHQLKAPNMTGAANKVMAASCFTTQPWKAHSEPFCCVLLAKDILGRSRFVRRRIRLYLFVESGKVTLETSCGNGRCCWLPLWEVQSGTLAKEKVSWKNVGVQCNVNIFVMLVAYQNSKRHFKLTLVKTAFCVFPQIKKCFFCLQTWSSASVLILENDTKF